MNDARHELLSRYIDGDLPSSEVAQLEAHLADDGELAGELEQMRELRASVASLAARMKPPAELDALLEPLRRSPAGPRRLQPAYTWLAAAATLVIGVSVAVEISRRNPAPEPQPSEIRARPAAGNAKDGYYRLQPLPTRDPETEELIGAADRLLASPLPDPPVAEPPPLEVLGPLSADESERILNDTGDEPGLGIRAPTAAAAQPEPRALELSDAGKKSATTAGVASEFDSDGMAAREAEGEQVQKSQRRMVSQGLSKSDHGAATRRSFVQVYSSGRTLSVFWYPPEELPAGRFSVTVSITGEQITSCRNDVADHDAHDTMCPSVVGLHTQGLADGDYAAELVISPLEKP